MSVFDIVTEKILRQLEQGTVPWKRPWKVSRAYNIVSGKQYSFLNTMLLQEIGPGAYGSYDQWTKLGGHVKKGAKASVIVFWKLQEIDTEDGQKIKRPVLRYHKIFHQSQITGLRVDDPEYLYSTDPVAEVEALLQGYIQREQIRLEEAYADTAYYDPIRDLIRLPNRRQFPEPVLYYSTFAHEAGHSTGHVNRLNRPGLKQITFGSETYSQEELIAEMTSAFLLNSIGIDTEETVTNSAAYIQNWMRAIQADNRLVVKAATQAEKAVNFIKGTT